MCCIACIVSLLFDQLSVFNNHFVNYFSDGLMYFRLIEELGLELCVAMLIDFCTLKTPLKPLLFLSSNNISYYK